jgi:hypothetical protein
MGTAADPAGFSAEAFPLIRRVAVFWPGGNDGFAVLGEESVLREFRWDCVIP